MQAVDGGLAGDAPDAGRNETLDREQDGIAVSACHAYCHTHDGGDVMQRASSWAFWMGKSWRIEEDGDGGWRRVEEGSRARTMAQRMATDNNRGQQP